MAHAALTRTTSRYADYVRRVGPEGGRWRRPPLPAGGSASVASEMIQTGCRDHDGDGQPRFQLASNEASAVRFFPYRQPWTRRPPRLHDVRVRPWGSDPLEQVK